jgi:predicted NUDIX family phosphoesterase
MSAPKMTLAFPHTFDPFTISVAELMLQPCALHDRAVCESDFSLLQPILYITLVDKTGPVKKYFLYMRGKAGGEKGLVGNCSIGLGGHTEEFHADHPPGVDLEAVLYALAEAVVRELDEEVGLKISITAILEALKDIKVEDREQYGWPVVGKPFVLFNPVTDVDKVHIAIAITIECDPTKLGAAEEGVIERGEWLTVDEIREREDRRENPIVLETWSKTVIANIMAREAA